MESFAINDFARRHRADSPFSYFSGSDEELLELIRANFEKAEDGNQTGIKLVSVPAQGFFSGVVRVTPDTHLTAVFRTRREGEEPFLEAQALKAEKLPAKYVTLVVYHRDTLGDDSTSEANWQLVSINASAEENEPQSPISMARNFLGLEGGTPTKYTAEEFAEAIIYWSRHALHS